MKYKLIIVAGVFIFSCYSTSAIIHMRIAQEPVMQPSDPLPINILDIDDKQSINHIQTENADTLPAFHLHTITIAGAKYLSKRTKKKLLKPYLYHNVSAVEINQLVRVIQSYYIENGYPTTKVTIPIGQNLQTGKLHIEVQIGFIEDIILNEYTIRDRLKVASAFLWFKNRPLYLAYLDQGLDQINAVASSKACLRILPGLQKGGSVIYIDQEVSKPVRLVMGGDNLGREESGIWRWKYHLDIDNLLSINDSFSVYYDINHAKVMEEEKLRAYHLMFKMSFPLGYFNFTANYNLGKDTIPITATKYCSLYTQNKYAQAYEMKCSLYKYTNYKGTIHSTLNHSKSENAIRSVSIINQSKPETQWKLGTTHTGFIYKGVYSCTISYEQGLAWFGVEADEHEIGPDGKYIEVPKRQFKKINYQIIWNRPFVLFDKFFHYQIAYTGQYSKDEIINSHQFSLTGSEHVVAGFKENYTGNKGFYCKQEVNWKHVLPFTHWLLPLSLVAGVDVGYLPRRSNTNPENAHLNLKIASLKLGLKYHASFWSIDFTYAKPLYRNKAWGVLDKTGQIYISCNVHLHELIAFVWNMK